MRKPKVVEDTKKPDQEKQEPTTWHKKGELSSTTSSRKPTEVVRKADKEGR